MNFNEHDKLILPKTENPEKDLCLPSSSLFNKNRQQMTKDSGESLLSRSDNIDFLFNNDGNNNVSFFQPKFKPFKFIEEIDEKELLIKANKMISKDNIDWQEVYNLLYNVQTNHNLNLVEIKARSLFYLEKYQLSYDLYTILLERKLTRQKRTWLLKNRSFSVMKLKDYHLEYPSKKIDTLIQKDILNAEQADCVFTMTTCKRFDLFEKTMNSFLNCCEDFEMIDKFIIVDDNSSESDRAKMKRLYPFINFIWKNEEEKGHPQSMNLIIKEVEKLNAKYVLHMEDDFHFVIKRNYISDAINILENNDKIRQVLFNRNYAEDFEDLDFSGGFERQIEEINYMEHEYYPKDSKEYNEFFQRNPGTLSNAYWPHYSLRPSLMKTSVFKTVGVYKTDVPHFEMDYAERFTNNGLRSAFFNDICCLHIGRLAKNRDSGIKNAYELNNQRQFI